LRRANLGARPATVNAVNSIHPPRRDVAVRYPPRFRLAPPESVPDNSHASLEAKRPVAALRGIGGLHETSR